MGVPRAPKPGAGHVVMRSAATAHPEEMPVVVLAVRAARAEDEIRQAARVEATPVEGAPRVAAAAAPAAREVHSRSRRERNGRQKRRQHQKPSDLPHRTRLPVVIASPLRSVRRQPCRPRAHPQVVGRARVGFGARGAGEVKTCGRRNCFRVSARGRLIRRPGRSDIGARSRTGPRIGRPPTPWRRSCDARHAGP